MTTEGGEATQQQAAAPVQEQIGHMEALKRVLQTGAWHGALQGQL
jgi:hypothetical protein